MNTPPRNRAQTLTAAHLAVETAAELVRESEEAQRKRMNWRACFIADQVLVCCCYCRRLRASNGEWVRIPDYISAMFRVGRRPLVSHGMCPACVEQHDL